MAHRIRKYLYLSKRDPDDKRKIFRHSLVTAIVLDSRSRRQILGEAKKGLDSGYIESLMIDSGGFQVLKRDLYSPDEMIKQNVEIYTKYDFASNYVLPDSPPILNEPLECSKKKIEESINGGLNLFNVLPEHIQKKCIPVFHIRDYADLDRQLEAYKHILELSGKCAWASLRTTAGASHKLTPLNLDLLSRLQKKLPSIKIHALGIGSRQAMYCLYQMGIYSTDSTSPQQTAYKHEAIYGFKNVHTDNIEDIEKAKTETGHECASCKNPTKLKSSWVHRTVHNLVSMDNISDLFDKTKPEQFVDTFPVWSGKVECKGQQMAIF